MDFDDSNSNSNININNDVWEWQGEEYSLQRDARYEVPHCLWDEVNVNADNLVSMFDEQTPIKDCLDFDYQVSNKGDVSIKGMEECTETSQTKRRRMLQFTSDTNNVGNNGKHLTSVGESSMMEDGPSRNLEWNTQWNLEVNDDIGNFHCEEWDQSSAGLLANCFNENEMHCSTKEMDSYKAFEDRIDFSEFCNISPQMETGPVQKAPTPASIKIYKGRKSFLRTPKKLATSVAYPFALIKPCGVQGDVTLKDINQRIHAPPPSQSKHMEDEDPGLPYPTSSFSGKPVVVKTKIRTEGGKGSITIMRTKGSHESSLAYEVSCEALGLPPHHSSSYHSCSSACPDVVADTNKSSGRDIQFD